MKPAPFVLVVLAVVVAMAWPLSSAIGAARASAASLAEFRQAACVPDATASAQPDDGDDEDEDQAAALPPGHPPVAGRLPPGHPPIPADALPPGHPPIGSRLPPGHPPIPSGRAPASPSPVDLFGAPVLLTI